MRVYLIVYFFIRLFTFFQSYNYINHYINQLHEFFSRFYVHVLWDTDGVEAKALIEQDVVYYPDDAECRC